MWRTSGPARSSGAAGQPSSSRRRADPRLVWCTISGFGDELRRPGYDFVVQAESGWMSITGEPDGEPMKHGVALADVLAGKDAAIAILAALVARGEPVSVAGVHVVALGECRGGAGERRPEHSRVGRAPVGGETPTRTWSRISSSTPPIGRWSIAVGNDAQWRACAARSSCAELASRRHARARTPDASRSATAS